VSEVVVLLRGINVGRGNRLAMADWRALLVDLGGSRPKTYLQSGQAAVTLSAEVSAADFAVTMHDGLVEQFGMDVAVMVRDAAHIEAVIAANPYPERVATPKQLHVVFLDTTPSADAVAQVGSRHGDDELSIGDGVIYASYARQSNDSPLLPALKKLAKNGTARNWTTVLALRDLLASR
jgi:uncharacterized protein (DUF1697 family)